MKAFFYVTLFFLLSCQSRPKSNDNQDVSKQLEFNFHTVDSRYKHQFIELEGVRWHFVAGGNPIGKTMLFLHGYPESWYSWTSLIPYLDPQFQYIFLDSKGFGRSEDLDGNFNWVHISNQIAQLMDTLKIEKFYLVGHDWGLHIAGIFAMNHQDRLLGFVRVGGALKFEGNEKIYSKLPYLKKFQNKEFIRQALANEQSIFFYEHEHNLTLLKREDKNYLIYEYSRPHLVESLSRHFNSSTWDFNSSVNLVVNNYFSFPVMEVILQNDKLQDRKFKTSLKKEFPNLNFVFLTTGHYPMWEKPKMLAELLNLFVHLNQ